MSATETGILAGEERMLINGELQLTDGSALFEVEHPGSGRVVGHATDATVADMERAVGAACRAFENTNWARDVEFQRRGRWLMTRAGRCSDRKELRAQARQQRVESVLEDRVVVGGGLQGLDQSLIGPGVSPE